MSKTDTAARNAPCPCGSGKKYKKCCLAKGANRGRVVRPAGAAPLVLYASTLVLAFCSIVYELLLAQTLSAFLGNTVLRYSVTIGLYMLSMGMGALLAQGRVLQDSLLALQRVEVLLTVIGGASVMSLFALHGAGVTGGWFSVAAHALIVIIGVLTGLEIPLLMEIGSGQGEEAGSVLGVDYLGAFLGTVAFSFVCYPRIGLVPTAFMVACLNAVVGIGLSRFSRLVPDEEKLSHRRWIGVQGALLAGLVVCLTFSAPISEFAVQLYLRN